MNTHVDKYSVLYTHEGEIYNCGTFVSENEAMDCIRKNSSEFDLDEQYVYILTPDHRLISVSSDDISDHVD